VRDPLFFVPVAAVTVWLVDGLGSIATDADPDWPDQQRFRFLAHCPSLVGPANAGSALVAMLTLIHR